MTFQKRFIRYPIIQRQSFKSKLLFTLKRQRKWTTDDFLALSSWFFLSNTFLFVAYSTTCISLVLYFLNSLQFQELVAYFVGKYITKKTGTTVIFDSAIIPSLKEGKIIFKDITVSRLTPNESDVESHYYYKNQIPPLEVTHPAVDYSQVDYTIFNIFIKEVKVKLSIWRMLTGKGLIEQADLRGIRGIVDKRYCTGSDDSTIDTNMSIEGVCVNDMSLMVFYNDFRPIKIDVFYGMAPLIRFSYLVHDLLKADNITGMYDNCLFTLHKQLGKHQIKIDNLPIDLFNYGANGPISWVTQGHVDVLGDVIFEDKMRYHLSIKMKDLKAEMPLSLDSLFGWQALVRPLISFLNNHQTHVQLKSQFDMARDHFKGAWSIYRCGLVDAISDSTGYALVKMYEDERVRSTKLKRLGIWSLGEVSRSMLKLFDYIKGRQNWWSYR